MKVGELIEELQDILHRYPEAEELDVAAVSDYGDHCHTQQLKFIDEVGIGNMKGSAYSDSGKALADATVTDDRIIGEVVVLA